MPSLEHDNIKIKAMIKRVLDGPFHPTDVAELVQQESSGIPTWYRVIAERESEM